MNSLFNKKYLGMTDAFDLNLKIFKKKIKNYFKVILINSVFISQLFEVFTLKPHYSKTVVKQTK